MCTKNLVTPKASTIQDWFMILRKMHLKFCCLITTHKNYVFIKKICFDKLHTLFMQNSLWLTQIKCKKSHFLMSNILILIFQIIFLSH